MNPPVFDAVTVTLNPAIDRTLTVPRFTAGAVNRVGTERSNPGGKGVNVASALADYGCRVAVTGFLGNDNAAPFETLFAKKRIADHFVRIPGATRVGIKIADPELDRTTDLNFPGLAPSASDLELLVRRLDMLDAGYFVVAGSLPPGVNAAVCGRLVRSLRARGRRVALDTGGEALRLAIDEKPFLIKPNLHELEELLGESLPGHEAVVRAARGLTARGIELVVVSMGGDGACFVTANAAVVAVPPAVEVRSTVGAGDALVAGIIAGQLENLPLVRCARLATAFSLDVLMRGAPGLTSRAEIAALTERVTANEL